MVRMNDNIDPTGYIVLFAALFLVVVMGLSISVAIKHGRRSDIANKWMVNTGIAIQLLGVALACSATTMPALPLVLFLAVGVYFFIMGSSLKRVANNRLNLQEPRL